jgi:hypothetical protein
MRGERPRPISGVGNLLNIAGHPGYLHLSQGQQKKIMSWTVRETVSIAKSIYGIHMKTDNKHISTVLLTFTWSEQRNNVPLYSKAILRLQDTSTKPVSLKCFFSDCFRYA